ncbi:MAG: hypothetical protein ORN51_10645 [Akkermansiaceae bacterium]|nr:hypothetical protein [Akkermansiaceae bacterium]
MKLILAFVFFATLPPIGFFFWFNIYRIFKGLSKSEIDHEDLRNLGMCLLFALAGSLWVALAPSSCSDSDNSERYEQGRP